MNRNTLISLVAGSCLLTGVAGGGAYWFKRGKAPTLAVAGGTKTESTKADDASKPPSETPAKGLAAGSSSEPLKPIPAPASDLADLRAENASPGRFQAPVAAEPVTPAAATISDRSPADATAPTSLAAPPPNAFLPFNSSDPSPAASAPYPAHEATGDSSESSPPADAGSPASVPEVPPVPADGVSATDAAPSAPSVPTPPLNAFAPATDPPASQSGPSPAANTTPASPPAWNSSPPPAAASPVPAAPAFSERNEPRAPASRDAMPGQSPSPPSFSTGVSPAITASDGGAPTPGPDSLSGEQAPALSIEKVAPPEIQVGKSASFQTFVRNISSVPAVNVVLSDRVPQGTRLVSTSPQGTVSPAGSVVWQLGTLKPNDEVAITMELMPELEGEIGSVAEVSFHAQASVRTKCTKPQLTIRHTAPAKVLIGDDVVLSIEISNPGTGAATHVILEEDVPQGLVHSAGRELEYDVGTLLPNETRKLELPLVADGPGVLTNVLRVRGEGGLSAEDRLQVEVLAPQIQVGVTGPARRYLERQLAYELTVANPGTAPAKDIDLVAYLPKGMKFMEADQQGQYDTQNHAVFWTVPELPPGQKGVVQITALPIETGEQTISVEGRAEMGLNHQAQHVTLVEGVTQLQFSVSDVQDPIEVQASTTYEVRVVNSGTKAATNVRVAAIFPQGMSPVSGEGPSRVTVQGQQASTDAIPQLAPGTDAVFRLQARGTQSGDHVIRVQLASDDSATPVTKEESTRVYADE